MQNEQVLESDAYVESLDKCPYCMAPWIKNEGCNHMTCTCKREFWVYMKKDGGFRISKFKKAVR
jgi:hypothetical protein